MKKKEKLPLQKPPLTVNFSESVTFSHDEIAARARELWQEKGQPRNRDEEIWSEAERKMKDALAARKDEERLSPKNLTADHLGPGAK